MVGKGAGESLSLAGEPLLSCNWSTWKRNRKLWCMIDTFQPQPACRAVFWAWLMKTTSRLRNKKTVLHQLWSRQEKACILKSHRPIYKLTALCHCLSLKKWPWCSFSSEREVWAGSYAQEVRGCLIFAVVHLGPLLRYLFRVSTGVRDNITVTQNIEFGVRKTLV